MNKQNETHGKANHTEKAAHSSSTDGTNSHTHSGTATEKTTAQHDAKHPSSTNGTNSHPHSSATTEKSAIQHAQHAKHNNTKEVVKESILSRILNFPQRLWHRFS